MYLCMKEEYLHYIFNKRLLGKDFKTIDNRQLTILDFGRLNTNAGPDFLNAKIECDGQLWVGPIEFHVKASDWFRHKHQNDPAYNTVIAHFVYDADQIVRIGNFLIPTVELQQLIDFDHYHAYKKLVGGQHNLLCASYLDTLPKNILEEQKGASLKERLIEKSILISREIEEAKGDCFAAYLKLVARCFGGQVNQLPFEELAQKIKRNWLSKLNYEPKKVEALFLGLSGFFMKDDECDPYIEDLKIEFQFQKHLFGISDHVVEGWKYSRMRPINFPDRRVAQFAQVVNYMASIGSFDAIFFDRSLIKSDLLCLANYWSNHYRIGQKTQKPISRYLSKNLYQLIQINVEVTYQFAMAWIQSDERQQSIAMSKLSTISSESNRITKAWKDAGVQQKSAYDSQALLAIQKQMCIRKKCLFCTIGKSILNK